MGDPAPSSPVRDPGGKEATSAISARVESVMAQASFHRHSAQMTQDEELYRYRMMDELSKSDESALLGCQVKKASMGPGILGDAASTLPAIRGGGILKQSSHAQETKSGDLGDEMETPTAILGLMSGEEEMERIAKTSQDHKPEKSIWERLMRRGEDKGEGVSRIQLSLVVVICYGLLLWPFSYYFEHHLVGLVWLM